MEKAAQRRVEPMRDFIAFCSLAFFAAALVTTALALALRLGPVRREKAGPQERKPNKQ